MTDLPEIPEEIRGLTKISRRENGDLIIACTPKHPFQHQQIAFINELLGPDTPISLGGLESSQRYSVLSEIFGNMARHHRSDAPARTIEVVIQPNSGTTVTSRGFVTPQTRARMTTKFEVAQSLTPAQAADRVTRIIDSGDFENARDAHGEESGGMGLLIQRAYSEGDLQLTFYPNDTHNRGTTTMQRFELTVELTKGRGAPALETRQIQHHGPLRSFFAHVGQNKLG